MKPEVKAYLDGDISLDRLPEDLRDEALAWDRLFSELATIDQTGAPGSLEESIMGEIGARGLSPRDGEEQDETIGGWLTTPRTFRASPLMIGLAAAGLAALLVVGQGALERISNGSGPGLGADAAGAEDVQVYVQFSLEAPGATSVSLAGDFSGWESDHSLEDLDGDGIWTARVPLEPGVHHYMFVIDGSEWVTDPFAERYADDGFGNRNAVLALAPPSQEI